MHGWEEYPRPVVTVDNVIFTIDQDGNYSLLLIKRRNDPYVSSWALPGGIVLEKEPPLMAAKRKLYKEANLSDINLNLIGVFGDSDRDPRGWFITIAFFAVVSRDSVDAVAGDDAAEVKWFNLKWKSSGRNLQIVLTCGQLYLSAFLDKKVTITNSDNNSYFTLRENRGLAFDHAKIIATAITLIE